MVDQNHLQVKTATAKGEPTSSWTQNDTNSPIVMDERVATRHKTRSRRHWILFVMGVVIAAAAASLITYYTTRPKSTATASDASVMDGLSLLNPLGTTTLVKTPAFKYKCTNDQCVQQNLTKDERTTGTTLGGDGIISLRVCEMTCGNGSMLPLPQTYSLKNPDTVAVNVDSFKHQVTGGDATLVAKMQTAFNADMASKKTLALGGIADAGQSATIVATIQSTDASLGQQTDESYELKIAGTTVTITAPTVYGYRHALATLQQLVDWCDLTRTMRMVATVTVKDSPAYKHRGILLDSARNFIPIPNMKRLILTMGRHKLNVLHLHMTDSSAFPLEIKSEPRFNQYGLYQSNMVYTQDAIKDLVAFAKIHGVRVIPEIDAPAHAGAGWQWGPDFGLGELTLCWANTPWMPHCLEAPCGQLNTQNDHVYELLDTIWKEIGDMFDSDVYHLGGDEVWFPCWEDSPAMSSAVKNKTNHADYIELWAKFQKRVQENLWKRFATKNITLWSSDLTTSPYFQYLPKDRVTVQTWDQLWKGDQKRLTDAGYSYIASFQEAHYLDCGLNGVARKDNGWCSPYKTWQVIYDQPLNPGVALENNHLVVGGELVLWTEVTGAAAMEDKIWPRAAAFAERTWRNPNATWLDAMGRMTIATYRIVESGVAADMIQPLWCRQNPTDCTLLTY
ncbi:unnamed protein product [Aphanomyces euteiches]|uniref:beta-N-acetylhexosaminidase n=1 Tax=Aphanomyces euteiches TaxID=100861 RepID=A0A6G0XIU5_9STRA|nr:hypothetical protein Ae201684_004334 [Aphanomyces euteiches]KAH9136290.1 hypothetical protein AeRB84_018511 [Aphanomyces euteiches]